LLMDLEQPSSRRNHNNGMAQCLLRCSIPRRQSSWKANPILRRATFSTFQAVVLEVLTSETYVYIHSHIHSIIPYKQMIVPNCSTLQWLTLIVD